MEALLFYLFAIVSVGAGVMVITRRNPIASVLWLVVVMFCLAALFLLQHAFFIAAVQVIVYAGAIMVLFLFVIMLLNLSEADLGEARPTFVKGLSVAAAGLMLLLVLAALLAGRPEPIAQAPAAAVAAGGRQAGGPAQAQPPQGGSPAPAVQGGGAPASPAPQAQGRAAPPPGMAFGEPKAVGTLLFTDFLIPFEIASVLLLAAMVGAVVLAKRELRP